MRHDPLSPATYAQLGPLSPDDQDCRSVRIYSYARLIASDTAYEDHCPECHEPVSDWLEGELCNDIRWFELERSGHAGCVSIDWQIVPPDLSLVSYACILIVSYGSKEVFRSLDS